MRGLGPFLADAWRLSRPYFNSEEKWSARLLLVAIVALNLCLVAMDVVLNFWNREFYNALQDKDYGSFFSLLLTYKRTDSLVLPGFAGIAVVYIAVAVYRTYLNQWLQIRWRRWLTRRFTSNWMADRAYYRISLDAAARQGPGDGTDNPDQRIAEDLRSFVADTLSLSLDLLSNIVSLFSFVTILWSLSGPMTLFGITFPGYMVWAALLYAGLGTWATHLVGWPLSRLNFQQQKVEADFRFSLVRLRENMEGVALERGEAEEQRVLGNRFEALATNWWAIMQRTKLLNTLVAGYGQLAVVFPIIVAAPRYFSGSIALGGLTQTAGAFGQVQSSMSWFVTSYASLAGWRATVERLTTFYRAIEAARDAASTGPASLPSEDDSFALDHATLSLPTGAALLEDASLRLSPGQSVVLSGRSGSGKSTLFRALAGIWPFGSGTIRRPHGSVMFLPQRPYLPLGTLRHAVCYPASPEAHDDAEVRAALTTVGLDTLVGRLDEDQNWAQRLSGGEQQRVAFARALLSKPDWLFLDEATASLDPQAESDLYAAVKRDLPNTTVVSIAHREAVAKFHQRHLVFSRERDGAGVIAETEPATS